MCVCLCRFCTREVPAVLWLAPASRGGLLQGYVIDYSVLLLSLLPTSSVVARGAGHARHCTLLHGYNVHVQPFQFLHSTLGERVISFSKLAGVCALIGVPCGVLCRELQSHDV